MRRHIGEQPTGFGCAHCVKIGVACSMVSAVHRSPLLAIDRSVLGVRDRSQMSLREAAAARHFSSSLCEAAGGKVLQT